MKKTLETQIKVFLAGKVRNQWVNDGVVKLYLRKGGLRLLEGPRMHQCLDLGTIEVKEASQGQGRARAAIALLESLNPFEAIFIENCFHPILRAALIRWGWQETVNSPWCFYRLK